MIATGPAGEISAGNFIWFDKLGAGPPENRRGRCRRIYRFRVGPRGALEIAHKSLRRSILKEKR